MSHCSDAAFNYLREHQDENIERIRTFLRQPAVASAGIGGRESAAMLMDFYRALGCQEVELIENGTDFPGVWAYLDAGRDKTLVNYCMYDTKPAQLDKWPVAPYEAVVDHIEGLGTAVFGPGAKGRKAPYVQWLNAVRAVLETSGRLPVNIAFLAEGEENMGSPHYAQYIDQYKDRVKGAIGCFCPGASQDAEGNVSIHLGYKGLAYLKLTASGSRWGKGPQKADAHGMAQVMVDSPAWRLVYALGQLFDAESGRVLVPGFYDKVSTPTQEEQQELSELADLTRSTAWQKVLGGFGDAKTSLDHLDHQSAFAHFFYQPSFNLNGLAAGYVGPGSPVFTLPREAYAMLDVRLPRGYRTRETITLIERHLDSIGLGDIDVEVIAAHDPSHTEQSSPFVQLAHQAVSETGAQITYWPYSGGGGPWSKFSSEFGMPVLFDVGLGHGGRAGGPGEYLVLESECKAAGNLDAEAFYAGLLERLG